MNTSFYELSYEELGGIDGGVDWDDLGFYIATGGGALVGGIAGGPVGAFIGGAIAGGGYILIDKAFD
jgi:hypothetical protein